MGAPLKRTGVPGVYRRGSRYAVMYRDPGGTQRSRSAATLAEARAIKAEVTAALARGEYREHSRVTVNEYATDWMRTYTGRTTRGIRPATLDDYRRDLGLHVLPRIGHLRMTEVEPRHIKALAADLSDGGARRPTTVKVILAPVRALFATAVEEGVIRSNPCTGLRLAGSDGSGRQVRALTADELARLIAETDPRWRTMIVFLSQTGVRIGEAIALRWDDVDLPARRVHVRRRLYRGTIDTPKSRYGIRDIPISRDLAAAMADQRAAARFNADADLVFPSEVGTALSNDNVLKRVLKPAAKRAGVSWAGLHTLRHTCASMLFRSGWNAKQVQMVMGHHSPAFTLATYVHLIPDDLPEPTFG